MRKLELRVARPTVPEQEKVDVERTGREAHVRTTACLELETLADGEQVRGVQVAFEDGDGVQVVTLRDRRDRRRAIEGGDP